MKNFNYEAYLKRLIEIGDKLNETLYKEDNGHTQHWINHLIGYIAALKEIKK